jgi:small GTP-binding protein
MKLKTQWALLGLFSMLPYLVLFGAGAWWLIHTGWWLWWMIGAALVSLAGWPLLRWLQKRTPLRGPIAAEPSNEWPPAAKEAWVDVQLLANRVQQEDIPLDQPELLLQLAREVVETVARKFHVRSSNPVMEVPIPHVLKIVELVARDTRDAVSTHIPGSHILTINDLIKLKRLATAAPSLYRLYRVVSLVINPATGLARELGGMATERMVTASTNETKEWAVQFVIRKIGFYAIELYSGNLVLRGVEFDPYVSKGSRKAIDDEQQRTSSLRDEPLRILVVGQVKAGKSSLINALFGETRAAVDVVPRTKAVEPYLIERDGLARAIILDTAGYEDATRMVDALDHAQDEIVKCDLVIMVSSALTAARDADLRLLSHVRRIFQQNPDRELPPLVVALTHIDQLRPFREWSPPYDLTNPTTPKGQQIREAVIATASDLQVDIERVIPVCLQDGQIYNVKEGLIPAIADSLGAADRLKYLRCIREVHDEQYWSQLRKQSASAGRFLLKTGMELLREAVKTTFRPRDAN